MTIFERAPRLTLSILLVLLAVGALSLLEYIARQAFGLGNPVVYLSHPLYGYRPLPNQNLTRFGGASLQFNNLALRASSDWDTERSNKIVFLGDSVTYGGSYIANDKLFSAHIEHALPGFLVGNAGVNAWGVENVQALVQEEKFLPAKHYISTFPEGDFLRGLNRLGGQPFWPRKPNWALEELYYYGLYKLSNHKYDNPAAFLSAEEEKKVIEHAVMRLKNMDDFLKAQGYSHTIFITPALTQALGLESKRADLEKALKDSELKVIYLLDLVENESPEIIKSWFYDNIHLSELGHQQWAQWMLPFIQNALEE